MIIVRLMALVLFTLGGCARFRPTLLKKESLSSLSSQYFSPRIEIQSHHLLDVDVGPAARDICRDNYLIAIALKNKTSVPLTLDPSTIQPAPLAPAILKKNIPPFYSSYFLPAIVVGASGFLFLWQVGLPIASLLTLVGVNQSRKAALKTAESIAQHVIDDKRSLIIPPHTTSSFVVAIRRADYHGQLKLSCHVQESKEKCTLTFIKSLQSTYALP